MRDDNTTFRPLSTVAAPILARLEDELRALKTDSERVTGELSERLRKLRERGEKR